MASRLDPLRLPEAPLAVADVGSVLLPRDANDGREASPQLPTAATPSRGARAVLGDDGLWTFPRGYWSPGQLHTQTLGAVDLCNLLDRLDVASRRRGVRASDALRRRVKRSAEEEAILEALCGFAESCVVDVMFTVTFSDEYAYRHHLHTLEACVRDVARGLRDVPMNRGKRMGFGGRFALAGEWHRTGREFGHVHGLLECRGEPLKAVCTELFTYFKSTRGRCRFEPIAQLALGTRYAFKDVLKQVIEHPTALEICTTHPKRVKHNIGRS